MVALCSVQADSTLCTATPPPLHSTVHRHRAFRMRQQATCLSLHHAATQCIISMHASGSASQTAACHCPRITAWLARLPHEMRGAGRLSTCRPTPAGRPLMLLHVPLLLPVQLPANRAPSSTSPGAVAPAAAAAGNADGLGSPACGAAAAPGAAAAAPPVATTASDGADRLRCPIMVRCGEALPACCGCCCCCGCCRRCRGCCCCREVASSLIWCCLVVRCT